MDFKQILLYFINHTRSNQLDVLLKYFILFLIDNKNISEKDQISCLFKYSNIFKGNINIMFDIQNLDNYQLKLLLNTIQ